LMGLLIFKASKAQEWQAVYQLESM